MRLTPFRDFLKLPVLVAIVAVAVSGFFYFRYQKAQQEIKSIKNDPTQIQKAAQEQAKKLVDEVGRLIDLPSEEPTIATISDISKLKDQPFFSKAKNGDKVLIFTNAKKAILYDPSAHKIIDVAPVNIGTSSAALSVGNVALLNGTTTVGLTTKVESQLKGAISGVSIVAKENAAKSDYDKTIVVALDDSGKDAATTIAKLFNVEVGPLPSGESKPSGANVVVILGKDRTSSQ